MPDSSKKLLVKKLCIIIRAIKEQETQILSSKKVSIGWHDITCNLRVPLPTRGTVII